MIYSLKAGESLELCLENLIPHIDVWGIHLVGIAGSYIEIDGEIPADQLDHLGLEV
jgi:hypothetical protein